MPTLSFLLYLLILGVVWLFRMAYVGWVGPYLFACVLWVPLVLLAMSLPSMLLLRLKLEVQPTLTRGRPGKLLVHFKSPALLPLRRVSLWLEVENRDRKSTRLNSSHTTVSRMPSSA